MGKAKSRPADEALRDRQLAETVPQKPTQERRRQNDHQNYKKS